MLHWRKKKKCIVLWDSTEKKKLHWKAAPGLLLSVRQWYSSCGSENYLLSDEKMRREERPVRTGTRSCCGSRPSAWASNKDTLLSIVIPAYQTWFNSSQVFLWLNAAILFLCPEQPRACFWEQKTPSHTHTHTHCLLLCLTCLYVCVRYNAANCCVFTFSDTLTTHMHMLALVSNHTCEDHQRRCDDDNPDLYCNHSFSSKTTQL